MSGFGFLVSFRVVVLLPLLLFALLCVGQKKQKKARKHEKEMKKWMKEWKRERKKWAGEWEKETKRWGKKWRGLVRKEKGWAAWQELWAEEWEKERGVWEGKYADARKDAEFYKVQSARKEWDTVLQVAWEARRKALWGKFENISTEWSRARESYARERIGLERRLIALDKEEEEAAQATMLERARISCKTARNKWEAEWQAEIDKWEAVRSSGLLRAAQEELEEWRIAWKSEKKVWNADWEAALRETDAKVQYEACQGIIKRWEEKKEEWKADKEEVSATRKELLKMRKERDVLKQSTPTSVEE